MTTKFVHVTACAQATCKEPTVGKSRYCRTHRAESRARFRAMLAERAATKAAVQAPVVVVTLQPARKSRKLAKVA
jgi:hypothetical protein